VRDDPAASNAKSTSKRFIRTGDSFRNSLTAIVPVWKAEGEQTEFHSSENFSSFRGEHSRRGRRRCRN
jgi:hypothetical protein